MGNPKTSVMVSVGRLRKMEPGAADDVRARVVRILLQARVLELLHRPFDWG